MAKRRALLSVSDKTGLVAFATGLVELGFEIVSTGGTARALTEAGVSVVGISDVTGFPEMLDGRVKTLHPAVHGGILARRSDPAHMDAIAEHGITPVDVLCVNLYPFEATVAKADVSVEDAVENIDIGGPAMVRSAAKNHEDVTVVVDPSDYPVLLDELRQAGATSLESRRMLAVKAYEHTARYDSMIASFLASRYLEPGRFPAEATVGGKLAQVCRYGENPHQRAGYYREAVSREPCIGNAKVLGGKELSFNNFLDANAALEAVKDLSEWTSAVVIKHTNPCGAAAGDTMCEAFMRAREGDPISAFGGILAVSRPIDEETAAAITGKGMFFEVVIAPGFEGDSRRILTESKSWGADLRLLEVGPLEGWRTLASGRDLKKVVGGFLLQDRDIAVISADELKTVTEALPSSADIDELLFAWRIVRHVKSNAIVFTRDKQVVGVGAGQMNRVQSVKLAIAQAGEKAIGAVMASDAFFPFPDGPTAALDAGIRAIIQPGGSKRDPETLALCNERGIPMVYTGRRHFRH